MPGLGWTALAAFAAQATAGGTELSPAANDVAQLAWLAGRWEETRQRQPHGTAWTLETWSAPRGGVMLGTSLTGLADTGGPPAESATNYEFMRIAAAPDGRLTFFASPRGAPASAFPVVGLGRYEVVFENSAHDYPQRISYRRTGNRAGETLTATISLIDGSRPMTWTYRRARPRR